MGMSLPFLKARSRRFFRYLYVQLFVFEMIFAVLSVWFLLDDESGTLIAV